MKNLIIFAVLAVLTVILVHCLTESVYQDVLEERVLYEEKIGQKVIIDKDTLSIIDYSMLDETLILSNGQKISIEYLERSRPY